MSREARHVWGLLAVVCGLLLTLPVLGYAQAAQTSPLAAPSTAQVPKPPPQPSLKFMVLIDAAHGGTDTGARLNPTLLEKNLTLTLSNDLRSRLAARGVGVTVTRTADVTLSASDRAAIANRAPYAACIILHATATGSGAHLYTSSLAPTAPTKFLPWKTAQSAYVTQSLKLASNLNSAFTSAQIPVTLGSTAIEPLDSFACPAVAVEIAPLQAGTATHAAALTDPSYQDSVLNAIAAAVLTWQSEWRQQP